MTQCSRATLLRRQMANIHTSSNRWLSKLASTFILTLVEEKLTPLNSLYFSTLVFLKISPKQSKTAKKYLHFTVERLNLVCLAERKPEARVK